MMEASDGSDDGTQDAFEADARRLCDRLAQVRRAMSLTSPRATKRDVRAMVRLLTRLQVAGVVDPADRVADAVDWVMGRDGGYWRRRLRCGRRLSESWDELVDDMTLDGWHSAGQTAVAGSACAAGHREDCEHVRRIGETPEFTRYPFQARHAHDRRLAALADSGLGEDELRDTLRGLLREDERSRRERLERKERETARIQQELAAERARRGGSMFVGARKAAA